MSHEDDQHQIIYLISLVFLLGVLVGVVLAKF